MKPATNRGFSLVELTVAMGLASFCLLSLYALLPIGLSSSQASVEQTATASLATSVAADLRSAPTAAISPRFSFDRTTPALQTAFVGEDGAPVANPAKARYRISLWCVPPAVANAKTATSARVMITWPALADAAASQSPARFAGSFETVIALDRS